jgi:hypothetical protein
LDRLLNDPFYAIPKPAQQPTAALDYSFKHVTWLLLHATFGSLSHPLLVHAQQPNGTADTMGEISNGTKAPMKYLGGVRVGIGGLNIFEKKCYPATPV